MSQSWETEHPACTLKSKDNDKKYQKKEVMSLVKESIKHMFNAKKRKTEKFYATEKKKDKDLDFEVKDFFKDLSESDNDE
jgi:hypothetical protein